MSWCHTMSINLNDIAILNICHVDYCCIINGIDESEVINLLQSAKLTKKSSFIKVEKLLFDIK